MLRPSTVVVTLLVALFALPGVATAAPADGWTVHTADNEFGSARDNYGYTVDPGGRLSDGLVVVNNGTTPLNLAVYAADAFTTSSGGLDLRTKDTRATDVGAWVHPGNSRVTVQPGQSQEVPFTLSVPADAAPGDHLGGIVTAVTQGNVERRVGIRIRLRVGGDLKPNLSVENVDVDYSGGDATVTYAVHNTGNAILAARQTVSVAGPFGSWRTPSGRVPDSPALLPGETWQVSVPVHGVTPAVLLTGTVTLTPLLADASGSISPLSTVEATGHGWAVSWILVLAVVVLGGLVVVIVRRRRRQEPMLTQTPLVSV